MLIAHPLLTTLSSTLAVAPSLAIAPLPAAFSSTTLLAELSNGGSGAQPSDLIYIVGVLGVMAFGGIQIFASTFAENDVEFVPPMPGTMPEPLKRLFGGGKENPEEACEALRLQLQASAQAGDLETAFRLEKELKQKLAETGIRYVVDEQSESTESLPDNW